MTTPKDYPPIGQIYTGGAFCEPLQWTDPETGKVQWRWVVVGFEDDSYMNGDYVDAVEYANTREALITQTENDE